MKLWLANVKEGEWDWFLRWRWVILIGSLAAAGFLIMLLIVIIIFNKGKI